MPTIPSRPKKQLCKRMFRHMGWDHTCSEQSKGNGEWIHSQKLQVELQMSAAQRVHPHSSAAVSQSCRWMQRSLPARQARSEHSKQHTRTCQQRRAVLQVQHQRTTSVPAHTTSPSTHRQVPCHPTAGLLASEQKNGRSHSNRSTDLEAGVLTFGGERTARAEKATTPHMHLC